MKKVLSGFLVAVLCFPVIATEGRWTEGYGQGNLEYFIDQQGVRLYIACPTQDGSVDSQSSVTLLNISQDSRIINFTVTVNGITYDGPLRADSRVGDDHFISLLESLKKGDAVVKFGNDSITFPQSNAPKVVPAFKEKSFSCNLSG